MEFNIFAITRDLLYLSGILVGIALGCIVSLFSKDITIQSRNRRISIILVVFSGAISSFALATAVSLGMIFENPGIFIVTGICILVFALAAHFPRAVAYPLILAAGLLAVWLGFSYLRFPLIKSSSVPLAAVYNEGEDLFSIQTSQGTGPRAGSSPNSGDRAQPETIRISGNVSSLEFTGIVIRFNRLYPLVGGTERGLITEIRKDSEFLFSKAAVDEPFLKNYYTWLNTGGRIFGITFQKVEGQVPFETIPQGMNVTVLLDGSSLSFLPSWPVSDNFRN
jgi:hypothetical protein